jgi:hypothetical protein
MSARSILTSALVLFAGLLAFVLLFVGSNEVPSPAPEAHVSGLRWQAGCAQQYGFLIDSSVVMGTHGAEHPDAFVQTVQGVLEMRTLEVDPEGATVGVRLSPVEFRVAGAADPATDRALSAPFRVRFTRAGQPVSFEFSEPLDATLRGLIEEVVRTFQVELRDERTWFAEERNGSGTYAARYVRGAGSRIEKEKTRYLPASTAGQPSPQMDVLVSTATFEIVAHHDWLARMTVDETLRMQERSGLSARVTTHASLELLPSGAPASLTGPGAWDFPARQPLLDSEATPRTRVASGRTPEQLAEALGDGLLALDAATDGRGVLIQRLVDLLLEDPELAFRLLDLLDAQEWQDRTRASVFHVFERAGTAQAQQALCQGFAAGGWSQMDGNRALIALGGVANPTPEAIASLWSTARLRFSPETSDHASTAALALGSLGSRLYGEASDRYRELRDGLVGAAFGARDARERAVLLMALGNTGDPSLGREVVPYLEDEDPRVRQAVAKALGRLGTDSVAEELLQRFRREESSHVRATIASSLSAWEAPSDAAMSTMRESILSEKDEAARLQMAKFLGRNLDGFPENRSTLQAMLGSETSKSIRIYLGETLMGG